jgi:hypothetical protein
MCCVSGCILCVGEVNKAGVAEQLQCVYMRTC